MMRAYTVYLRRPATRAGPPAGYGWLRDKDIVLIPEAFSWFALIAPLPWALWHKLWRTAILMVVGIGLVAALTGVLIADEAAQSVIMAAVSVLIASAAGDIRGWEMERSGFAVAEVVAGPSLEVAEHRLLVGRPDLAAGLAGEAP